MPVSPKHAATCAAAVASSSSPIRSASTIRRPHPLQRRVNVRRMGRLYLQQVPFRHGGCPAASYIGIGNSAPVHARDTASTRADKGPALLETWRVHKPAAPAMTVPLGSVGPAFKRLSVGADA